MAGWPGPRGCMGISYVWTSDVLFPSKEKHRRIQQKPEGWAWTQISARVTRVPWPVWTPAAQGAPLAEVPLVPGLAVMPAGSGHAAALVRVAVVAGWHGGCLTSAGRPL